MAGDKLILILPVIVFIGFIVTFHYKGSVQTYLLFVLYLLPFMAFKVVKEDWGGFKIFDIITFYSLFFLFRRFSSVLVRRENRSYFLLFLLMILITFLGILASEFPGNALIKVLKILPVFIFSRFLVTECLIDREFFKKIIHALKASFIFCLLFLLIQVFVGLDFTWYPSLNPNIADSAGEFIRFPGVFYDPQSHGQYLALGSFLFLVYPGKSRRYVFFNVFIFLVAILTITITGSRSAFGGFCVGLALVLTLAGKRYISLVIICLFLGFLAYNFFFAHSPVFHRTGTVGEDLEFRQSIWNDAFQIANDNPYLGIGWGNYQNYIMRHSQDQYLVIDDELLYFDQPENGYLKILVEIGYFGFIIFLMFIIQPIIRGVRIFLLNSSDFTSIFLIASLISWMVSFNTVYSFFDERILIIVVSILALLVALPGKMHSRYENI